MKKSVLNRLRELQKNNYLRPRRKSAKFLKFIFVVLLSFAALRLGVKFLGRIKGKTGWRMFK
jgi:hypothetical protein